MNRRNDAVSDVIGEIKQYTAKKMREKYAWLKEVYWKERVVWSPGYFVSTVGLDEKQITEYVRWQGGQDSASRMNHARSPSLIHSFNDGGIRKLCSRSHGSRL